jgi:hypothetical protein
MEKDNETDEPEPRPRPTRESTNKAEYLGELAEEYLAEHSDDDEDGQ